MKIFPLYSIVTLCLFVGITNTQSVDKELGRYLIGFHENATHFVTPTTDISNVLQNVLNTLNLEGGGKVTIAPGTYYISQNILIGSNIHIDGYGMKTTTLQLVDFASQFQNKGVLRCVQNSNIVVSNLTIDGNKFHQDSDQSKYVSELTENVKWYGRYGLYTEDCVNVTYDSILVTNFQVYGIVAGGTNNVNNNSFVNNLIISNSFVTYNDFEGILVGNTVGVFIHNTTTKSNGRNGYAITSNSKDIIIENSYSYRDGLTYPSAPGCGIQLISDFNTISNVSIISCLIVEPKIDGVCLNKVTNVWMENNRIYSDICVDFQNSNYVTVVRNICFNPDTIHVIQANNQNQNIVISENDVQIGRYVEQNLQNLEIIIGYSDKATHIIQQGANAYQQIQQSLDDIRMNGGGVLRIEPGLYILSSYIEVGSNTVIIGSGMNETVLKLMDFADPWWIPNTGFRRSGFIRSTQTSNLFFANFTIDGNKQNQNTDKYSSYGRYGFFTEASDNVTVDGMGVINFQGYGFDPHGIKETKRWSIGLTIINSYSANNDWDGFTIDQSTNVFLANNVAHNNGRHGYNIVTGSYNVLIYNNIAMDNGFYYYHGNPGCGIAIQNNLDYGTRNISVIQNIFQNNDDAGICIRDVSDILLENNTIANVNYTNSNESMNLCVKITNSINVITVNNVCNDTVFAPFVKKPINKPDPKNSSSGTENKSPKTQVKNGNIKNDINKLLLIILSICVGLVLM